MIYSVPMLSSFPDSEFTILLFSREYCSSFEFNSMRFTQFSRISQFTIFSRFSRLSRFSQSVPSTDSEFNRSIARCACGALNNYNVRWKVTSCSTFIHFFLNFRLTVEVQLVLVVCLICMISSLLSMLRLVSSLLLELSMCIVCSAWFQCVVFG